MNKIYHCNYCPALVCADATNGAGEYACHTCENFKKIQQTQMAYVFKDGDGKSVIIAIDEAEARQLAKEKLKPNAELLAMEPVKAYNMPNALGIVLATSINEIKFDQGINMEYWDAIDDIIRKHTSTCIEELKQWSITNIDLTNSGWDSEENVIFELSKSVGEIILKKLESWGGASFPVWDETAAVEDNKA